MSSVMDMSLGLGAAFLCAFFTNLAALYKHRGSCAAPDINMRHPLASAVGLWRSPWFAIGMGVAGVAFALHVVAIASAPLSLVQAVIAGGLVWLAVLADRCFGMSLGARQ